MPRTTTSLPLSLPAPPLGASLCIGGSMSELRSAILEGRLHPGARLPATRDLDEMYRLSRATIVTAFEQLKSEGYVEGRSGSGTYVSKVLPEQLLQVRRARAGEASCPTGGLCFRLCETPASRSAASATTRAGIPRQPARTGPVPDNAVGASRVPAAAAGVHQASRGRRNARLSSSARSGR